MGGAAVTTRLTRVQLHKTRGGVCRKEGCRCCVLGTWEQCSGLLGQSG